MSHEEGSQSSKSAKRQAPTLPSAAEIRAEVKASLGPPRPRGRPRKDALVTNVEGFAWTGDGLRLKSVAQQTPAPAAHCADSCAKRHRLTGSEQLAASSHAAASLQQAEVSGGAAAEERPADGTGGAQDLSSPCLTMLLRHVTATVRYICTVSGFAGDGPVLEGAAGSPACAEEAAAVDAADTAASGTGRHGHGAWGPERHYQGQVLCDVAIQ